MNSLKMLSKYLLRIFYFHCGDQIVNGGELLVARFDRLVEERRETEVPNVLHERHLDVSLQNDIWIYNESYVRIYYLAGLFESNHLSITWLQPSF